MAYFGLDCTYQDCVHDSVRAFRLRFQAHRNQTCQICNRPGQPLTERMRRELGINMSLGVSDIGQEMQDGVWSGWFVCLRCFSTWKSEMMRERNDMIFKLDHFRFAVGQYEALGAKWEGPKDDPYTAQEQLATITPQESRSIPPWYDYRVVIFNKGKMPRVALYFDWRPTLGEILTSEKVFQLDFTPGADAATRRSAGKRSLTKSQFEEVIGYVHSDQFVERVTTILCQHCGRNLPLKVFNTRTLRECELGD